MTREEIIQEAKYSANGTIDDELAEMYFIRGAKWADEHPKEGLWDKEKVTQWLKENFEHYAYNYGIDEVIAGITKAMEKIQ